MENRTQHQSSLNNTSKKQFSLSTHLCLSPPLPAPIPTTTSRNPPPPPIMAPPKGLAKTTSTSVNSVPTRGRALSGTSVSQGGTKVSGQRGISGGSSRDASADRVLPLPGTAAYDEYTENYCSPERNVFPGAHSHVKTNPNVMAPPPTSRRLSQESGSAKEERGDSSSVNRMDKDKKRVLGVVGGKINGKDGRNRR